MWPLLALASALAGPGDQLPGLTPDEPPPGSLEEYGERFVGFADGYMVHKGSMTVVGTFSRPHRGTDEVPLRGRRFYDYVGRPDLGDAWLRRSFAKSALLGVGMTTFLVGFFGATKNQDLRYLLGVGAGLALTSAFVQTQPVTSLEARALAETFNTRLRMELGLAEVHVKGRF